MPVTAIAADPVRTLGAGLVRAGAAMDAAAARVASDPFDVDALVEVATSSLAFRATASALRSVSDAQESVLDLLA